MMARKMPKQKPGKSETIVRTPPEFLQAVKRFLGIKYFAIDLAALPNNSVGLGHYTPKDDALSKVWSKYVKVDWCWLNPPYDNIRPWAKKCAEESKKGVRIAFLIPASVGSNWWRDYVHEKARVYFLNGRLTFLYADGTRHKGPYPKDLALVLYGDEPGYDVWNWRKEQS